MKQLLSRIICFTCIVFFISTNVSASYKTLEEKCLFREETYIDTCPEYRKQTQSINEVLYTVWEQAEQETSSTISILEMLAAQKEKLQTAEKLLFTSNQRTPTKTFYIQYMINLINLYEKELEANKKVEGSVKSLFQKTYFNLPQEGIVITNIALQNQGRNIQQYDPFIPLSITIRNYDQEVITNVEDVYCFASIFDTAQDKEMDYIFPLKIPIQTFNANSIKSINITLPTKDHPLLEQAKQAALHCTMVYQEAGIEIYTPYFSFDFLVYEG